jgi:hypothetical protein
VEAGANHDDSGAGSAADDASRDSAPADVSVADGDAAPPPGDAQATFIVFATSTPVGGDMMGVAMADAHCTTVAHAAGFPMSTTFVAWLSTAQKSAGARLVGDGPWHVPRADLSPGQLVAFDKVQLVGGVLSGPINRDEHGVIVARTVWTGTASNGGALPASCSDWSQPPARGAGNIGTVGASEQIDARWTTYTSQLCTDTASVYCFQVP